MSNPQLKIECSTFEEAKSKAADAAASSFSLPLQVVMFEQAGRTCYSTSLPMGKILDLIRFDSAARGDSGPEKKTNRPIMLDHVRNIKDYLVQQEEYILPAITLNVRHELRCYTYATTSATRAAILIVPAGTQFFVTDGQHRLKALGDALAEKSSLANNGVAVMIVEETNINRIHQDFADCAQTKAIPPSLLTLYDHRDDLSRLTRDVVAEVALFENRIEKVGKTVAKNSQNLYTLNQVRVAVAEALIGDASATSATVRSKCSAVLGSEADYDAWLRKIATFFDELSDSIPEWKLVRDNNAGGPAVDVSELRPKFIHFTGTGLTIIGRVGYEILKDSNAAERRQKTLELANKVNWSRETDAGRKFWVGSILTDEGGLVTSKSPMTEAVVRVKRHLGLPLSNRETDYMSEDAKAQVA